MKYRFMAEQRGAHSVGKMAEVLDVSRSGYHAWLGRPPEPAQAGRGRADRGDPGDPDEGQASIRQPAGDGGTEKRPADVLDTTEWRGS